MPASLNETLRRLRRYSPPSPRTIGLERGNGICGDGQQNDHERWLFRCWRPWSSGQRRVRPFQRKANCNPLKFKGSSHMAGCFREEIMGLPQEAEHARRIHAAIATHARSAVVEPWRRFADPPRAGAGGAGVLRSLAPATPKPVRQRIDCMTSRGPGPCRPALGAEHLGRL